MNLFESIKNNLNESTIIKAIDYTEQIFKSTLLKLKELLSESYLVTLNDNKEIEIKKDDKVVDIIKIEFKENDILITSTLGISKVLGGYTTYYNTNMLNTSDIDRGTIQTVYSFFHDLITKIQGGN